MKRLGGSDSLGALISMCPAPEEQSPGSNHHIYSREYHSMLEGLDEDASMEEFGHVPEKKRRLSVTQVKALEKSFDVENKLEPERKVKLAHELGLQPRQVAVWFQNRRARWKTKQLERDYGVLKSDFDDLKINFDSLQRDKDALLNEIKELKSKLNEDEENRESDFPIKEETKLGSESKITILEPEDANMDVINVNIVEFFKDGQSDSDSSAILNDDQSPNASNSNSSSGFLQNHQISIPLRFNSCDSSSSLSPSSSINRFITPNNNSNNNVYNPQFVKMEEHNLFGEEEEACDFFSDEQAPTLQWCCSDSVDF